jgi:hypothetical protein
MKRYLIVGIMVVQAIFSNSVSAGDDGGWADRYTGWYICAYLGQLTDSDFWEVMSFQVDTVSSYMVTLAVGKEVWRYRDWLGVELEAQIAGYFNDYVFECDTPDCIGSSPDDPPGATQDHKEFNALFAVRWLRFPWDHHIDTSVAVGEGLSYATSVPAVEAYRHGEEKTSKLLNYLMVETAFGLPSRPRWQLIFRVHHRSGVFGLFNDVYGGSNTIGMGLRYQF